MNANKLWLSVNEALYCQADLKICGFHTELYS